MIYINNKALSYADWVFMQVINHRHVCSENIFKTHHK